MERRKYKRIDTSFSFCYKIYRRTNLSGDISKIENISIGGAQLTTSHELTEDNILELTFRTPQSKKKIILLGKVLECKKDEEKSLYISRISFAYPDKLTQELMSGLIKELNSR